MGRQTVRHGLLCGWFCRISQVLKTVEPVGSRCTRAALSELGERGAAREGHRLVARYLAKPCDGVIAEGGAAPDEVEAMHQAWVKAVLLQVILWSHPYVREGDF
jgi:hypothetical protein